MRDVKAARLPVLLFALLASGCAGADFAPFGRAQRPVETDSDTVQRITGRLAEVAPLTPEDGNVWPAEEAPRSTLQNPDMATLDQRQNTPALERAARERGTPPQPDIRADDLRGGGPPAAAPNPRLAPPGTARRGSSSPPPPPYDPGALPRLEAAPGEYATPPAPRLDGQVIPIPGGPPAITSGGTGAYQTYTQPGVGGGIAVPGGAGTTLLGPGGGVQVVPNAR